MWAPLGNKQYILKSEKLEDGCKIYASDFVRLWVKRLKNEEIVAVSKEMNPLIEAPELKLVQKVFSLFDGNNVINRILDEKESDLTLYLESDLSGVNFHFKLQLELQDAKVFFKEITLPFMLLAARLQIREKKLIETVLKKEAEINEYKKENEVIKRSHLITKEFNRSELMEGELEESNSSFAAIMNNPSTILNIVDAALFESANSYNLKHEQVNDRKSNQNVEANHCVNASSVNAINNKRNKRNNMKTRSKSKIDIINTGAKKKGGDYKFNLRF